MPGRFDGRDLRPALGPFVCRNVRQYDGLDGEPLVFHAGAYQVARPHPACTL